MQLVEFGESGKRASMAMVGNEDELRRDKPWTLVKAQAGGKAFVEWFRRAHGLFAKLTLANPTHRQAFQLALDDCLNMGEPK